jgi:hypothetical protein
MAKYIAFWEYDKKDEEALFERFKKRPEAQIKRLFPACCLLGQTKGFSIMEEDDLENAERFAHHYTPLLRFEIFPFIELEKLLAIRKY